MAPSLALGVVHPPPYEETTSSPIDPVKQHYLTCTRPSNMEDRAVRKNHYSEYWAFRKWIYEHPSSTVASSPFWPMNDEKNRGLSWKEFQPGPHKPTTTKRAEIREWLRQLRKSMAKNKTAPPVAESGTPLQPGDIEYTIEVPSRIFSWGPAYWTKDWGWAVTLHACSYRQHYPCSDWVAMMQILLHDLPEQLRAGGIAWQDVAIKHAEIRSGSSSDPVTVDHKWERRSFCSPRRRGKKWTACVILRHQHQSLIRDFRKSFSAETIWRADIYQRTGPRKFKRIMVFFDETTYGNYLTGQPVDDWHDGLLERFTQFIRPLLPSGQNASHEAAGNDAVRRDAGESTKGLSYP